MSLAQGPQQGEETAAGLLISPDTPAPAHAATPASRTSKRAELRDLLKLAIPVVLAEIGWMSMGIVDTLMVGPLGPQAIGAAGLGSGVFSAVGFFGMGLLLGLDTLVSHAFGARRIDECHRWLFHGLALAVLIAFPLTVAVYVISRALAVAGLHPEIAPLASSYLALVDISLPPLLMYGACRRYLQAIGFVAPVTFALISANLVNAFGNWVLIYGHFGLPAMGTDGAALATVVSRAYMACVVIAGVVWYDYRRRGTLWQVSRRLELAWMRRLLALGGPAAAQLLLEIGVFASATLLAGKLTPVSSAAHQISLNIISFVFMVPLGMASAGAVMVGRAIGRHDPLGARRAGWMTLGLGAAIMTAFGLVLIVIPARLIGLFTTDTQTLAIGSSLLLVASVFQLFDGLQVVGTGVLRGIGDTRTPMIFNLIGHWMIGLPVGWWLCFRAGYGVVGLWIGLSIGLTLVGIVLVWVWSRKSRSVDVRARAAV
jgi:multidrug resistance protein, MATE family